MKTEFGILGLGVMGKSLARNFANNGFSLSLFNRHVDKLEVNVAKDFIEEFPELNNCLGFDDLESFVNSLESPRKILIMVNAGKAIDMVIENLSKYLKPNDILIDGGNSHYKNTDTRNALLSDKNIHFIGMGVSGGEEGALNGPSLMPGGNKAAYLLVENHLKSIAAKDLNGHPCCKFIGKDGAGHFVKMVHNGIEYAEMQLITEVYSILRFNNGLEPNQISEIFSEWNKTSLENYLLESTSVILKKKEGDAFLVDMVLDKASHKGTGSWTTIAAAELGVPFTMSTAALNARYISSLKDQRVKFSKTYDLKNQFNKSIDNEVIKHAYQIGRLVNHHQGFQLIQEASVAYNWYIDLKNVAGVWTRGCIIASKLMIDLAEIINDEHLVFGNAEIVKEINSNFEDLKTSVVTGVEANIPTPCLSQSLNYLNAMTEAAGTGNIIQAQRDYFGAHTYKRTDDPNGKSYHTNWNN
jgi:6-phosphogluconate dehydrogenase